LRSYDPAKTPNSREWLALDEARRIVLITKFVQTAGEPAESIEGHAGIHAAVETQIAMNVPNVRAAMGRLRKAGLSRHRALHAIGAVLAEHIHDVASHTDLDAELANDRYYERLGALTAPQ
jgi:hypothetical protein